MNLIKKFFVTSKLIFFFPISLFFLILYPVLPIKFGILGLDRIGNIYLAELFLLKQKYRKERNIFIWTYSNKISNNFLLKILKRNLILVKGLDHLVKCTYFYSKYFKVFRLIIIEINYDDNLNLFDKFDNQIKLTKQEIKYGTNCLKKFGIPKNAKIICISNRDSKYLKTYHKEKNFGYHNYRDSNINSYKLAINYLIKKNFYVVRMGKIASTKLFFKSKKFIDYPFHKSKNDFMDFFLAFKCKFWVDGNNGLASLPHIFRKPVACVNYAHLHHMHMTMLRKKILINPKIYLKNSKKMSISEVFASKDKTLDILFSKKKNKIKILDNSNKEIKNICKKMIFLISNGWKLSKKEKTLQKRFREVYSKNFKHNINFKSILYLGSKKNYNWFLK